MLSKIRRQVTKDYVVHPLLSGPSFVPTVLANFTANTVRNLWSHSIIMCGHFPEGVETFEKTSIDGETAASTDIVACATMPPSMTRRRPTASETGPRTSWPRPRPRYICPKFPVR